MRRFTTVCDFEGGTYVSQLSANDVVAAAYAWADELAADRYIPRHSGRIAKLISTSASDSLFGPCELSGLSNVWQMSASVGTKHFCITIVESI